MRLLGLLFCTFPLFATEYVNFLNLVVDPAESDFTIHIEPSPLIDYDWLKDENFNLPKDDYDIVLDAPFRQTVFMLRTLERNRGTIMKNGNLDILSYEMELDVQDPSGENLEKHEYKITFGLSAKRDTAYMRCDNKTEEFSTLTLATPEGYNQLLARLCLPLDGLRFKLPAGDFAISLAYRWPRVEVDSKGPKVFDLFPSAILWNKGLILQIQVPLGRTFCTRKEGALFQVHNSQLKQVAANFETYHQGLLALAKGEEQEAARLFEDYLTHMPADRKALKKLMDLYMKREEYNLADNLIRTAEPLFATIREGLSNRDQIAAKAGVRRNWLLGQRSKFKLDKEIRLKITSPENGDLVSGATRVDFKLEGNKAKLLSAEVYLDDALVTKLAAPPYQARFSPSVALGKPFKLRVVAFFENETYQADEIELQNIKIDQEQGVRLVSIYATAIQSASNGGQPLSKEDFEITEQKKGREISFFRREDAPLRIAVVVDTSLSMFGDKLNHAAYAVKSFLGKLASDDRATVYTFDQHVVRMSEYTSDFQTLSEQVMTLQPQLGTSLYDAMLVAGQSLLGQNGTKVMIVISDGDDSSSAVTDIHVSSLLREFPIMVYSVILPGGIFSDSDEGARFMKDVAAFTGSISTKLGNPKKLDEIFEKVYQDMRNLYLIGFYSDSAESEKLDLKIKAKSGANVRFRTL